MGRFYKRKDALGQLFDLYERSMYYYALKITANPDMAEDVVQDAFCKLIKYIDTINYENDKEIKSYIFAVIKTCAADNLRKVKNQETVTKLLKENSLYIEDDFDVESDIDKAIGEMTFDGSIGELLSKLKEEDQVILYLRYGQDASDKEIIDILNLNTEAAVRKRLSRARTRLKDLLKSKERE